MRFWSKGREDNSGGGNKIVQNALLRRTVPCYMSDSQYKARDSCWLGVKLHRGSLPVINKRKARVGLNRDTKIFKKVNS